MNCVSPLRKQLCKNTNMHKLTSHSSKHQCSCGGEGTSPHRRLHMHCLFDKLLNPCATVKRRRRRALWGWAYPDDDARRTSVSARKRARPFYDYLPQTKKTYTIAHARTLSVMHSECVFIHYTRRSMARPKINHRACVCTRVCR